MRRFIQYASVSILLMGSTVSALAGGFDYSKEDIAGYSGPSQKSSDAENPYARDGKSLYFFTGYAFVYRFWTDSTRTVFLPGGGSQTYQLNQVFAKSFNSLQVGLGKEWGQNFDFQLTYLQYLSKARSKTINGTAFNTKYKMNGLLTDVAYILNPDSQFQVSAKAGVIVAEGTPAVTANSITYYPVDDSTQIQPAIGMDLLLGITPSTGIRTGMLYVINTQDSAATHGDLMAFIGLNHTL